MGLDAVELFRDAGNEYEEAKAVLLLQELRIRQHLGRGGGGGGGGGAVVDGFFSVAVEELHRVLGIARSVRDQVSVVAWTVCVCVCMCVYAIMISVSWWANNSCGGVVCLSEVVVVTCVCLYGAGLIVVF